MEHANYEKTPDLAARGEFPPIETVLNRSSGASVKTYPLEKLSNVSFISNNPFGSDLSKLGEVIKSLPIHLPNDGAYFLELSNNELHVYKSMEGIEHFNLVEGASAIEQIAQNDEVIVIDIRTKKGLIRLVLHRYTCEECKRMSGKSVTPGIKRDIGSSSTVRRTTSPWRPSQLETYRESESSESCGGCSGER